MSNHQMFPLVICLPLFFGIWMSVPIDVKGASDIFPNIACKSKEDCASINGSTCQSGICECPENTPIFVNASKDQLYCLPTLNITEGNCSYSQQCNYNNSRCVDQLCTCKEKFKQQDGICIPAEKSKVIPIVIGVVIGSSIILTLCIYLWIAKRKN